MNNKHYVVGYYHKNGEMSTYSYGGEIQYASEENIKNFLEYVKKRSPADKWKIYEVEFKEIK